jgi:SSS family solute:Na+ symporter
MGCSCLARLILFPCWMIFLGAASSDPGQTEGNPVLAWRELPPLPPSPGNAVQPGVAGAFVGIQKGTLIVAGGANFPDAVPWRGGTKTWHDTIYTLSLDALPTARWKVSTLRLPRPLAYGASLSTEEGVVFIGGCDRERCSSDVFLLKWEPEKKEFVLRTLPSLPEPLAFMGCGFVNGVIYVSCGQETMNDSPASSRTWRFDLAGFLRGSEVGAWEELVPLPSSARILPVSFALAEPMPAFYLFSGRTQQPGKPTECLVDGWRYLIDSGKWERLNDAAVLTSGQPGRCLMAGAAVPLTPDGAIVLGGADEEPFVRLEKLSREIGRLQAALLSSEDHPQQPAREHLDTLEAEQISALENHAGFSREVYYYDSRRDSWASAGQLPFLPPVTTSAVRWKNAVILPSGETRPGVRTPDVWIGALKEN